MTATIPPEPVSRHAPALRGPALLDQVWRDLTFLHWRVDADLVAPLLPPGVVPDVHDGTSWVGLIPFRLTDARFGSGPVLPYVGSFAETNVRLYGVDASGRRGVVFASLEAQRLAFVVGSRVALNIPYTWAKMRAGHDGDRYTYESRRRWPAPRGLRSRVDVEVLPGEVHDDPLADFLTARWGLFTRHVGRTWFLPNEHAPWPLQKVRVLGVEDQLVAAAGLPGLTHRPPDSALFSAGIRTVFGGPQRVDAP
ncbi:MAG: YqjF family protein [Janthinobacterium lividum]